MTSPLTPHSGPSMKEVVAFLLGEGPLNGMWFGDELLVKGRYWWRSILRETFAVSETSKPDPLSPAAIIAEAEKQKPDPIAELCESIRKDIRLCDHGYIHITCGQCVATWLRG